MYSKQHKISLKIAQRKLCKTSYPWALKYNIIRDIDIYWRQQILILKIRWLKNVKVNGGSKMPFFIEECHLVELEGWRGVALNEHVAARGLVLDRAVLLLDLHDPNTKKSYRLVCSIGASLFQSQKKRIFFADYQCIFSFSIHNLVCPPWRSGVPDGLERDRGLVQP